MVSSLNNFVDLKHIVEHVDNIFSLLGLMLNFGLLYLIINKTSTQLHDYRRVLLQNCIVDLCFNLIQFFTRSMTDYKDGHFFIILTNAFGHWSPPYVTIPAYLWVLALFSTLLTLPVQFVYRYFLIVKSKKLNNKQYALLLSVSLFFAISYTTWCLYVTWPREPDYTKMTELLTADVYYSKEIPSFITADIRNWPLFVMFCWCYSLAGGSYAVIVWSSYAVWKHLKANAHYMSAQTRDANHQISKTLIMQATLPVFVCLIPIAFTVTMVFLRANIVGIGLICSLLFAWIPVVNTIVTISVVKAYRMTVLKLIRWPTARNHVSVTTVYTKDVPSII